MSSTCVRADRGTPTEALLAQLRPRARSLIVTVFGDAILPHGGTVWLGGLIRLAAPLGLAERTVRTAVWRLTQDGILAAEQVGRRSLYRLTADGRRHFESAQRRIYTAPHPRWTGGWHLVLIPPEIPATDRDALRRELGWLGYAAVAPTVLAYPHDAPAECAATIDRLGLADTLVTMTAESAGGAAAQRALVASAWPLDEVAARYRALIEVFAPFADVAITDPEIAFAVRVLLIHAYRRALLRDPGLPAELLPAGWPGTEAAALTAGLYRALVEPAQRHVAETISAERGPDDAFGNRFAGA